LNPEKKVFRKKSIRGGKRTLPEGKISTREEGGEAATPEKGTEGEGMLCQE